MSLLGHTSLATWVYAIHHALEHQKIDADQVFLQEGLSLSALKGTYDRIPKELVNRIWKAAITASNNDAFSLKVIDYLNDPSINALITSIQASEDIRHALTLLMRYYKLISSGIELHVHLDNEICISISDACGDALIIPEDIDICFGLIVKYGSKLSEYEVRPSRLKLKRSRPDYTGQYEEFFQCPIEFSASEDCLYFPLSVLDTHIPSANPILANHVEQFLAEQYQKLNEQNLEQRLRASLLNMLPTGTPKLEDLAKQLNMSKRTLQRKLKAEDLCFQTILNDIRLQLAKLYLKENTYPVQEIACRLGFSDPSNFVRFFKLNEGKTPSEFNA